jgi:hypothetical protein
MSVASRFQVSAQPLAKKTAGLIEKETLALRSLSKGKYRIMNIECRRNVFYLFYGKIERSETILRYSAVRYSIFYGSLLNRGPAIEAADLIKVETFTCGASYKESEIQAQKPSAQKWFAFDCSFSDA